MATITNERALELIRQIVHEHGSQLKASAVLDITPSRLSEVLKGMRPVPDSVARKLGYRRVIMFEKIEKGKNNE